MVAAQVKFIQRSIQQAFILMHMIINYGEEDIKLYNNKFKILVENIKIFVLLHYLIKKIVNFGDNSFYH